MKEASGELSMTAIAVIAIAAIGVVFTTLIWPSIRENIKRSTYCSQAISCDSTVTNGMQECTYCIDTGCNTTGTVKCSANNGDDGGKTDKKDTNTGFKSQVIK